MTYQKSLITQNLKLSIKYILIILLSFSLTLTIPTISNAQISLLNANTNSENKFSPWWKIQKTSVCGKLWCSDVQFSYFPYTTIASKLNLEDTFTIASRSNLAEPQTTANELEIRATVIEQTWLSLYQKIVRNAQNLSHKNGNNVSQKNRH